MAKGSKRKKHEDAPPKSGLDDALGVGVAAVAMIAGAGVAAGRQLRTRVNGRPLDDTAPVVAMRPAPSKAPTGIKAKLVSAGARFPPLKWALRVQER